MKAREKAVQQITKTQKEKEHFKEKLKAMEKGIHALTRKVVCHETQIKDVKKKTYMVNASKDTINE